MKTPNDPPLLNKILADEKLSALRRTSLDAALPALRRARRQRRAVRSALVCLPLLLAGAFGWRQFVSAPPVKREIQVAIKAPSPAAVEPPSKVKIISDEELLALFPNRAVAIIGKPGHQKFVFLSAAK